MKRTFSEPGLAILCEGAFGDIHGLPRRKHKRFIVKRYLRPPVNDIPVFGPALVPLQAQTFLGENDNFLVFIPVIVRQDFIIAPGPVIFGLRFFKNRFIDLNVFFNHAVDGEILFNMAAAPCPVNIFYFRNGIYCPIQCLYEKTVLPVFDKFGHAPPVKCDHRGAAGHRLYNGQAERFIELYGMEQCGCLAEQPVALNRVGTADINSSVLVQVWFDVLVIVGFILDDSRQYQLFIAGSGNFNGLSGSLIMVNAPEKKQIVVG